MASAPTTLSDDKIPLLHLKRKSAGAWEYSSNLTSVYLDVLNKIAMSGMTFKDKNALLTGVGKGSIGTEIVKVLLSGGAHIVIMTSRYSRESVSYYLNIFAEHGSHGAALTGRPGLVVVPTHHHTSSRFASITPCRTSTLILTSATLQCTPYCTRSPPCPPRTPPVQIHPTMRSHADNSRTQHWYLLPRVLPRLCAHL